MVGELCRMRSSGAVRPALLSRLALLATLILASDCLTAQEPLTFYPLLPLSSSPLPFEEQAYKEAKRPGSKAESEGRSARSEATHVERNTTETQEGQKQEPEPAAEATTQTKKQKKTK
ncbi:unnamed protein product [Boreogadus saida]